MDAAPLALDYSCSTLYIDRIRSFKKPEKKLSPFLASIMLCLQSYNHYTIYRTIFQSYHFSYPEINEVEAFIRENLDKRFLIVTIPTTPQPENVHFYAKVADTYLLYPNSFLFLTLQLPAQKPKAGSI